jgi:hypothetical protein
MVNYIKTLCERTLGYIDTSDLADKDLEVAKFIYSQTDIPVRQRDLLFQNLKGMSHRDMICLMSRGEVTSRLTTRLMQKD